MSNDRACTHIKVTGVRCNSPALRGEQFCYFHQNAHRGVRRPQQSRLHPIAVIEDEESIQFALMEVINALMRNTIDVKRATLIIRALHIAVKNAARVKFGVSSKDAVTQVPDYAEPTAEHEEIALQSELPAIAAAPYKPVDLNDSHFWEYQAEGTRVLARQAQARKAAEAQAAQAKPSESVVTERVGTGAFARPASEASASVGADAFVRPGREATVPPAAPVTTAAIASSPAAVPPHNFKKPPSTARPAPQERNLKANRASRG